MRRARSTFARQGNSVVDEEFANVLTRTECGCNSIWVPPNLSLPLCATCPDGAPNRFKVNFGWVDPADETLALQYSGVQTLTGDPSNACLWKSAALDYFEGDDAVVSAQWVLDLSPLVPTLTLDVGDYGKIVFEMDAPSFGCSCPTPFRRKCVQNAFPLIVSCYVCVTPPSVQCGNNIVPETLTASTPGDTINPLNANWNFPLNYDEATDWLTEGIQPGWSGGFTLGNGVDVYVVFNPCRDLAHSPQGHMRLSNPVVGSPPDPLIFPLVGGLGTPHSVDPVNWYVQREEKAASWLGNYGFNTTVVCDSIIFPPFGSLPIDCWYVQLNVTE